MMRRSLALLILSVGCVVAIAPVAAASSRGAISTASALRQANWGSNVAVSFGEDQIRYRSNGLPNHELLSEYAVPNPGVVVPNASTSHVESASDSIKPQFYDFSITTSPRKAKRKTNVQTGPVGLMISGAMTYNPFEGDGKTVALASNFTIKNANGQDVPFVDPCLGHPAPRPLSAYHYHGLSGCVTRQVDKGKRPSHIIGIAFDGFPIYGDRDIDGKRVKGKELDACNGITSPTPEFPKGIYHYVLLNVPTAQSSIRCFRGKVDVELSLELSRRSFFCPLRGAGRTLGSDNQLSAVP